jgi:hypothetical protein
MWLRSITFCFFMVPPFTQIFLRAFVYAGRHIPRETTRGPDHPTQQSQEYQIQDHKYVHCLHSRVKKSIARTIIAQVPATVRTAPAIDSTAEIAPAISTNGRKRSSPMLILLAFIASCSARLTGRVVDRRVGWHC